jgi:hypothetical protein
MKLSEDTLELLRNFAQINENIYFQKGNVIRSLAETKNIMAKATIAETIPMDFGIYNLGEFLKIMSLVDDPELQFEEKSLVITGGGSKARYYYSDPETLTYPPHDLPEPSANLVFTLTKATMDKIRAAANAFRYNEMVVTSNGDGSIGIGVTDENFASAHSFTTRIEGANYDSGHSFRFVWEISNFRFLPHDYVFRVSKDLRSTMTSTKTDLTYWIAMKKKSSEYTKGVKEHAHA